jgi:hypothetical protein
MRTAPPPADPLTDRIVVLGTGKTAVDALWRLAAASAHVCWHVDHADLGAEIVLANALGRGRLELSFGDAHAAPRDGAATIVAAADHGPERGVQPNGRVAPRMRDRLAVLFGSGRRQPGEPAAP